MDSKFLGKDGLTQTSANHLANIAKEMYEALEAKLESLKLVSRDFVLAAVGTSFKIDAESPKEELEELEGTLKEIASLKALIAWLREGIKAKESLSEASAERHPLNIVLKAYAFHVFVFVLAFVGVLVMDFALGIISLFPA